MGFDASKLMQSLADGVVAHADRDGLTGLKRDLFLMRGWHPRGEACPTEPPPEPVHDIWCDWPEDECHCALKAALPDTRES